MNAPLAPPPRAQRYLDHAIAPSSRGVVAVELDLVGRVRLNQTWYDFESTLRVEALQAFLWRARVHRGLIRFSGQDRYDHGHGEMIWRLYGLVPVVHGDDADVSHSARGRAALEQCFLPAALARPEVRWRELDDGWLRATWTLDGEEQPLELKVDEDGALQAMRMQRWSDADGTPWHFVRFGGEVQEERSFEGLTVPGRFTAGWFHGGPRWEEGRFFEGETTGLRVCAVARSAG